jgi:hypothetical protein
MAQRQASAVPLQQESQFLDGLRERGERSVSGLQLLKEGFRIWLWPNWKGDVFGWSRKGH